MGYGLGVDLGTTFTGAAVARDGAVTMYQLGGDRAVIPSVVLATEDGTLVTGEAAEWRAVGDSARIARGFKRRLGDPTPIIVGGAPYSPAALLAALLRDVLARVADTEGGPPAAVVLTCPAVWGPYRRERFDEVPRLAGLNGTPVTLVTEPEAAATHYVRERRLGDGELVAVYDLGGGTFDATVLRAQPGGLEILGTPEGIELLGGIDFDDAIIAHVDRELGGAVGRLDPANLAEAAALTLLRRDCVAAKELLSTERSATVAVLLPDGRREVALTRAQFEDMIRPPVELTIDALRRALGSAGVEPADLAGILLVGGSARVPLIGERVSHELGRPVRTSLHPKYTVPLGAAALASVAIGALRGTHDPDGRPGRAAPVAGGGPAGADAAHDPEPAHGDTTERAGRGWPAAWRDRRVVAVVAGVVAALVVAVVVALAVTGGAGSSGAGSSGAGSSGSGPASSGVPGGGSPATPAASTPIPTVLRTIKGVGDGPQGAAVTPDGRRVYVPSRLSSSLAIIDATADRIDVELDLTGPAQYVAIAPDGSRAYVTMLGPANAVAVIDTASQATVGEVRVGPRPFVPAVSPDGSRVYVPDHDTSSLWIVPASGGLATNGLAVKPGPYGIVISPDGARAYVVNHESNLVTVVDLARSAVLAEIPVGALPTAVAISPDGRLLYVTNYDDNSVTVVDTGTDAIVTSVQVGGHPQAVAFAPDGRHAYVANNGTDSVSVIETAGHHVTATVYVGDEPWSVAVTPDGRKAYVANALSDDVTVIETAR